MISDALRELAARCGVELEWYDVWGTRHDVPESTIEAVLAAMGVDISTPEAAAEALTDRRRRQDEPVLPPVLVVTHGEPIDVPAHLEGGVTSYRWTLRLESGETHGGPLSTADLRNDSDDGSLRQWRLPIVPGPGYHTLVLDWEGAKEGDGNTTRLIVAPARAWLPRAIEPESRLWGWAVQLYSIRSARDWGYGDFSTLRALIERSASQGAAFVGVNPLHALFPYDPSHASPYSPSSRSFLNPLYIDVEAVRDFQELRSTAPDLGEARLGPKIATLRGFERTPHTAVAKLKFEILRVLFESFRKRHLGPETARGRTFRNFQDAQGLPLRRHAVFEALQAHFHERNSVVCDWRAWPEPYRRPSSRAVTEFANAHKDEVEFREYLQWIAEMQLEHAAERSRGVHLPIGIYRDLAVSVSPAGSDAWADQDAFASGVTVGAPPDAFNRMGQDWGLPPMIPDRLTARAYSPFIQVLRRNMRHAGALRIDHVMALHRVFWIPNGAKPADGAYVRYPLRDLMRIVALESVRNRCVVVGEDLGTVPDEVRAALHDTGVLSYRLFLFERDADGAFRSPERYPRDALVAVSTHDLPTLAGFWEGRDITARAETGSLPEGTRQEQLLEERARERDQIATALSAAQLLPGDGRVNGEPTATFTPSLARAVHEFLARSPAMLMAVQPEDALGVRDQVNLPGTVDAYPNWTSRIALPVERWNTDAGINAIVERMRPLRGFVHARIADDADARPQPHRIPSATYRLQLHRDFGFRDAAAIVPYLHTLGISHVYTSPFLEARPGSKHGYDVVNHNRLNPELGDERSFNELIETLERHGMGLIIDVVPNHMGVMGKDNRWWLDVLENGPASSYASYFDIDWRPARESLHGRVLVPVLGDHYGPLLERGELQLALDVESGSFHVEYHEHIFPIDPRTYPDILTAGLARSRLPGGSERDELESLIGAFGRLPSRTETRATERTERYRDKEIGKQRLAHLLAVSPAALRAVQAGVDAFDCDARHGVERMHALLEQQGYRLSFWRVAGDEINYRRFFDINDLAALRVETTDVFEKTHARLMELVGSGAVDGLRIDHPDGLHDPAAYLDHLVQQVAEMRQDGKRTYLIVEKVLQPWEHLAADWPIDGTTGYEFLNLLNGLFVEGAAESALDRLWARFTGIRLPFEDILYQSRMLVIRRHLSGELNMLANLLDDIAQSTRRTRDFTRNGLRDALAETAANFPVYRTYIDEEGPSPDDRRHVEWAVTHAIRRSGAVETAVYAFVRDTLLVDPDGRIGADQRRLRDFAMRFQQFTAPVMAKGLEDTAFYRYGRLLSLCEVGGDPRRFGVSTSGFHRANQERARRWPNAMLATSTHDTKRSEDVRARINVLTELHEDWQRGVFLWNRMNRRRKSVVDGELAPRRADEYVLYQTLIGLLSDQTADAAIFHDVKTRVQRFMRKAVREARVHSSWVSPNAEYETAIDTFVERLFENPPANAFLASFVPFQQRVARIANIYALSQKLLALTAPGVPDIYQGTELLHLRLVDPDNRAPVDFTRRECLLREHQRSFDAAAAETSDHEFQQFTGDSAATDRAKLLVVWRTLAIRAHYSAVFAGSYIPLETGGTHADRIVAFAREGGGHAMIVVAPVHVASLIEDTQSALGDAWADTRVILPELLAGRSWIDAFTLRQVSVRRGDEGSSTLHVEELFRSLPVALLTTTALHNP